MNETLIKNSVLDYELGYADNDGEPDVLFDAYGNPAPDTLQAFYEIEHGLTEEVSFEELMEWANE